MENRVIVRGNVGPKINMKKVIYWALALYIVSILLEVITMGRLEFSVFVGVFTGNICNGFCTIIAYAALGIVVLAKVLNQMMEKISIEVTETRVTGREIFGKRVDLPIKHISAVSESKFGGIAVGTSAGKICFYFIQNREEVMDAIRQILEKTSE